ncbi:MAG: hypothetical protein CM15mP74_09230 [Halieaceae bacterium]|nr:MAG: hypothetical protein CM15mP74_09230 [Halieaceae bacterium]
MPLGGVTDELVSLRQALWSIPETREALLEYYERLFSPGIEDFYFGEPDIALSRVRPWCYGRTKTRFMVWMLLRDCISWSRSVCTSWKAAHTGRNGRDQRSMMRWSVNSWPEQFTNIV